MSLFTNIVPSLHRGQSANGNTSDKELGTAIKPLYEVNETPEGYALTVYLPGVAKENLEITCEQENLQIVGRRTWKQPEGWTALYRESEDAPYQLVLEHANAINVEGIQAELKDGVLRVALPKAEALKPRKIAVS